MTQSAQGRKFDEGKLRYDLIPVLAQEEVVKVITLGAEKYDPENWKNVPEGRRRYYAAAIRHMEAWRKGERQDEIGTHHIANAISNLMFILEKELRGWEDVKEGIVDSKPATEEQVKVLRLPKMYENPQTQEDREVRDYYLEGARQQRIKVEFVEPTSVIEIKLPVTCDHWYPDNSGEWIEYDGSGQPVEDGVNVEVLYLYERENRFYDPCIYEASDFCWEKNEGKRLSDIVAYKVVKS